MHATLTISAEQRHDISALATLFPTDQALTLFAAAPGGQAPVTVPPSVAKFLKDVLHSVHTNGSVRVHSTPETVTTTVAADMLGVSRPTLIKWLNDHPLPEDPDHLPNHMVGTHTRFRSVDVMAHRERRAEKQRAAFEELRRVEEEIKAQG